MVELHWPKPSGDRGIPVGLGKSGSAIPARCQPLGAGDGGAAATDSPAQATSTKEPVRVNPVQALREIGFLLERSRADTYRVRAYRGAAR